MAERGDLPIFTKWLNDPEVTEHLPVSPPRTLDEEEKWYDSAIMCNDDVLAIETKDGRLIGSISLMDMDYIDRKVEIGILIGEKDLWSKGYGTDSLNTILTYLFNELNMNRVSLYVDVSNLAAVHCYEKCGFRKEGTLREYRFKNGGFKDCYIMSTLRSDHPQLEPEATLDNGR
jgi:RimJ/RimL family protein N-acetyltransferase